MSDHEDTHRHTASPRMRRRWLGGYRIADVDATVGLLRTKVTDLELQAVELREELLDVQHEASETRNDLARARAELRYWNDRASYVDAEVARARARAADIEREARTRADALEADAQERSLQLIDRVCAEAAAMLQAAREEARDMFLRYESEVDVSHQKLEKLEDVRTTVARSMQAALQQFEDAVRELDKVGPARRIVEQLEQPARRPVPTFGRREAIEAAKRFEAQAAGTAEATLSSPLPNVFEATVEDVEATPSAGGEILQPVVHAEDAATTDGDAPTSGEATSDVTSHEATTTPRARREHAADDEFSSLLL